MITSTPVRIPLPTSIKFTPVAAALSTPAIGPVVQGRSPAKAQANEMPPINWPRALTGTGVLIMAATTIGAMGGGLSAALCGAGIGLGVSVFAFLVYCTCAPAR